MRTGDGSTAVPAERKEPMDVNADTSQSASAPPHPTNELPRKYGG